MNRAIYWPPGEVVGRRDTHSPFHLHDRTPLRLTIYVPDASNVNPIDERALRLLRLLNRHISDDLALVFAGSTELPCLEISDDPVGPDQDPYFSVVTTFGDDEARYTAASARNFGTHVQAVTWRVNRSRDSDRKESTTAAHSVLKQVAAHSATRNDVLVTTSPVLLGIRDDEHLKGVNILSPQEATRLVGLLLHRRHNFHLGVCRFDGACGFYLRLSQIRLPELQRQWSACVYSAEQRGDDLMDLGTSMNVRLHRALEEKDAIGYQFYQRPGHYTRDATLKHLD
jgi:hypothetical protein